MNESISPQKSLGQHFLIDENIARKIVQAIDVQEDDIVVEIGPGKGALTKYLLDRARKVIAIELDQRTATYLQRQLRNHSRIQHLEILRRDFLTVDLRTFVNSAQTKLRIVGNIPYYITSPIIFKTLEQRKVIRDLVIMAQLEVVKRIVSKPKSKEYGILSVFCQFYSKPTLLFKVSPNAFFPKPKVNSALLRLDFCSPPKFVLKDEALFVNIVRATFGKRRKTLRNGLKFLRLPDLDFNRLSTNLNLRPEQLSVQDFVNLSNELSEQLYSTVANTV